MKIEIGDKVSVNINNGQMTVCHEAIVQYIPRATGDSWQFIDKSTDMPVYVSEGCTIVLLEKSV